MMWPRAVLGGSLALTAIAGGVLSMARAEPFPHEVHAGLFPTCMGCHRGIPTGVEPEYFSVAPADCSRCHDGAREERVEWAAPVRTASNLSFVHAEHDADLESAGEASLRCQACHGPFDSGQPRMAVGRAVPETCIGCHAHEAPEHLAGAVSCESCHRPLADTPELTSGRVAGFPEPPSHETPLFAFEHGSEAGTRPASCAVCHARETCTRCHLNADAVAVIQALPPDPRVAELVDPIAPEWPEPESHEAPGWEFGHGSLAAAGTRSCANCHAQASCRSCHGPAAIPQIATLPDPGAAGPSGVSVPRTRAPGHGPTFVTQHGAAVAADLPKCTSCHVETQCAACHDTPTPDVLAPTGAAAGRAGPAESPDETARSTADERRRAQSPLGPPPPDTRPGYHPDNFLMRHGAEAFAVQSSCSDCHSTEVFCRDCHTSFGQTVGAGGGAGGAFHDAQPNWFFEHGRAARQGLGSCVSCHQQTSCLRCHSARSGLRVNPHGPGFDPDRIARRSTISCGICHRADQIRPPSP